VVVATAPVAAARAVMEERAVAGTGERAAVAISNIATDRVVFTYEVDGHDLGILTGYEQDGGFFLEHVVAFPGATLSTLVRMLKAGLARAWTHGYRYVSLFVESAHPHAGPLEQLARRLGFTCYTDDGDRAYYVKFKETIDG